MRIFRNCFLQIQQVQRQRIIRNSGHLRVPHLRFYNELPFYRLLTVVNRRGWGYLEAKSKCRVLTPTGVGFKTAPLCLSLRWQSTEFSHQKQGRCLLGEGSFSAGYIRKYKMDVTDGEGLIGGDSVNVLGLDETLYLLSPSCGFFTPSPQSVPGFLFLLMVKNMLIDF